MTINISKKSYSLKAVRDTIYWLSKDHDILLDDKGGEYTINCENPTDDFRSTFLRYLNDYSLRDQINEQTREIKSLIMAKAFYPEMVNFKPVGEFDDPVNTDLKNEAKPT